MEFEIEVAWDCDLAVWYVRDSTIPGLHAEAATYNEFFEIISDVAPDLISANKRAPIIERRDGSSDKIGS